MFTPPVILDTNVFVGGAFNEGSNSRRIVEAVRNGNLLLVWSDATRRETLGVLGKIPPLSDRTIESLFEEAGRFRGTIREEHFGMIPDPTDRKFAGLAEATGVALVSSDSDLVDQRYDIAITIHTPTEYVGCIGVFET